MINKKSNREEVRKNSVTIPMTAEEKEQIKKLAHKSGMAVATYVRYVLIQHGKDEQK